MKHLKGMGEDLATNDIRNDTYLRIAAIHVAQGQSLEAEGAMMLCSDLDKEQKKKLKKLQLQL